MVKEYLWRPLQKAILGKQSTTELTTKEIDKVFDTNKKFLECLSHTARTSFGKNIQFAPLTLSTMTITGQFSHASDSEMPIGLIRDALAEYPPEEGLYLGGMKPPHKRRSVANKEPNDVRKFRHQVSFMLDKKSAKLFYNGTIHATGFSSLVDFLHMIVLISQFVEEVVDINMNFVDFNINMINSGTVVQSDNFPLSFPPKAVYLHAKSMGIEVFFESSFTKFGGFEIGIGFFANKLFVNQYIF
jgi:hypothetical protein